MAKERKEWYIIVNPLAGSGKTMSHWVPAERYLKKLNVPYRTVYTTHKHHAEELAATAARMGYRRILAVGGDGSVHEVFSGVLSFCEQYGVPPEDFYLAVVPIGSGNDWIKAFDIPNDTKKVVEILARGKFEKEDVIRLRFGDGTVSYMANVGGTCFDSHVCERVNSEKERGKRKARIYLSALMKTIVAMHPIEVAVYCDGELFFSGSVYDIALGNGPYCGGGMQQCCLAEIGDGLLDMIVVPKLAIGNLMKELPRIYKKNVHESKRVIYKKGKNFRIVPLNERSEDIFEIDGEIVGRLPVEIDVLPCTVNVLTNK